MNVQRMDNIQQFMDGMDMSHMFFRWKSKKILARNSAQGGFGTALQWVCNFIEIYNQRKIIIE